MPLTVHLKILLSNDFGSYLVLQRPPTSKRNAGKWDLPGGKIDPEKPYLLEMKREVSEETGLAIDVGPVIGLTQSILPEKSMITLIFRGQAKSTDVKLSDEHSAFKWVSLEEAHNLDFTYNLRDFFRHDDAAKDI